MGNRAFTDVSLVKNLMYKIIDKNYINTLRQTSNKRQVNSWLSCNCKEVQRYLCIK